MQWAVVEFARHVCGLAKANSTEVDPMTTVPIVDVMADQKNLAKMGATMRLGEYSCKLTPGTAAASVYPSLDVMETPPPPLRIQ